MNQDFLVQSTAPILFYDSDCALCDGFVRFTLRFSPKSPLLYAPLLGQTSQHKLPSPLRTPPLDTVVLVQGEEILTQAQAVLRTLCLMGGIWKGLSLGLSLIPLTLLNRLYAFVAQKRKLLNNKDLSCPVPPSHLRDRFLP